MKWIVNHRFNIWKYDLSSFILALRNRGDCARLFFSVYRRAVEIMICVLSVKLSLVLEYKLYDFVEAAIVWQFHARANWIYKSVMIIWKRCYFLLVFDSLKRRWSWAFFQLVHILQYWLLLVVKEDVGSGGIYFHEDRNKDELRFVRKVTRFYPIVEFR